MAHQVINYQIVQIGEMHRYSSDHYYISRPQVWIHCSRRISGQTSFCNLRRNTDDPPSATPGHLYGEGGEYGDDGDAGDGDDGDELIRLLLLKMLMN